MKPTLLALVLFVATAAHAGDVPLFTPAAKSSEAEQARVDKMMQTIATIVSITPVTINGDAFDSSVITLQVEGKEYRYERNAKRKDRIPGEWSGALVGGIPNETTQEMHLSRDRSGAITGAFYVILTSPSMGGSLLPYNFRLEPGMLIKEFMGFRNGVPMATAERASSAKR